MSLPKISVEIAPPALGPPVGEDRAGVIAVRCGDRDSGVQSLNGDRLDRIRRRVVAELAVGVVPPALHRLVREQRAGGVEARRDRHRLDVPAVGAGVAATEIGSTAATKLPGRTAPARQQVPTAVPHGPAGDPEIAASERRAGRTGVGARGVTGFGRLGRVRSSCVLARRGLVPAGRARVTHRRPPRARPPRNQPTPPPSSCRGAILPRFEAAKSARPRTTDEAVVRRVAGGSRARKRAGGRRGGAGARPAIRPDGERKVRRQTRILRSPTHARQTASFCSLPSPARTRT